MILRVLAAALPLLAAAPAYAVDPQPPRLVLQVTVDQLRGDLLPRYAARFGEGGARWLMNNGVVYLDAHHAHANTETIVGHATLATGAQPAVHGMIGNVWFDRALGRLVYNIEDPDYPILTKGAGVDQATEIDPTQRAAGVEGRSPRAILTSTFGDELALATNGRAKVFGVSVKDRGAVAMAGHAGKAFWFSKQAGEFITSRWYYDAYPQWVTEWNARGLPAAYAGTSWDLLGDRAGYLNAERDDLAWETDLPGFGRVFPHAYGPADGKLFTTLLTVSPAGDALTVDFAKALIDAEDIGGDDVPDYLSVSLSSTDYVGHIFGSSSLEMEDQILRLDRALADLLAFVDKRVGLSRTLIVLSADHGGAEPPGRMAELGIPATLIDPKAWDKAPGLARLKARFGIGEELIAEYFHPYVYLDHEAIAAAELDLAQVQRAVAEEIERLPGVSHAVSAAALETGAIPDVPLMRSVLDNYNRDRSGDVFVVFQAGSFINDFDGLTVAAHHGSPWTYDTFVPMIFAGAGIAPRLVSRPVETVDLARTLSAALRIKPPSGAMGRVLGEVVEGMR